MTNFLELEDIPAPGVAAGTGYVVDDQSWLGSAAGTNFCESIMLDGTLCLAAFPNGIIPSGTVLGKVTATGKYAPYAGSGNSVQTVTLANATGGTFTVTYDGETTAAIAFNATGAQFQTAVEALSNVQPGDIVVGKAGSVFTVSFVGSRFLGSTSTPLFTANGASLTGTSPTVTVAAGAGSGNPSANEVQSVTINNANAGTFRLVFEGEYTGNIAYNAVASTVQTALEGLAQLDAGDVVVSGGPASSGAVVVTFSGSRFAGVDVPQLQADESLLQNTSTSDHPNPSITITTTTQGNRAAGTGGVEVAVGHLFTVKDVTPRNGAVRDVSAALFWGPGKIIKSKLPPNSGYSSSVANTLTRIRYV